MANVGLIIGAVAVIVGIGLLLYEFASETPNQEQNSYQNRNPRNDVPPQRPRSWSRDSNDTRRRRRVREERREKDCSICLEDLGPYVKKISCGHSFHHLCIDYWFNEGHATCPNCRQEVH